MSELQQNLEQLMLRLDHMGMRVEQCLTDALRAAENGDIDAGLKIDAGDIAFDQQEIEIEQECIRLLALYQPAAVDLRTICTIIKVNNDLERIADLGASIGRRVKHVVEDGVLLGQSQTFQQLKTITLNVLNKTIRMLSAVDLEAAREVIRSDTDVNSAYKDFARDVLDSESRHPGGAETTMTTMAIAKALERTGDLCTNIAEDVIFMKTGEVIRHAGLTEPAKQDP